MVRFELVSRACLALALLPGVIGCADRADADAALPAASAASIKHSVTTLLPPNPGSARVESTLGSGLPAAIPCARCHDSLEAPAQAPAPDSIDKVHQGLQVSHGTLSCYACHDPADGYRRLRLADGTAVEYGDVMTLCSQCHGPQRTDYDHGAHGGMTGYWDLSRGPRSRHACTVCHDPHAPSFPHMRPMFKPVDRFLTRTADATEDDHGH